MDVHAKTNLSRGGMFDSLSQIIEDDPASIRPIHDRLLVRDVPDAEKSAGGIVLTAAPSLGGLGKSGRMRLGDVVATGKGDPYFQWMEKGKVKIRAYPCAWISTGDCVDYVTGPCPRCEGRGFSHVDLIVKPGDRVVIDRRKEAEFQIGIGGARYTLCHEQQAVYGIMRKEKHFKTTIEGEWGESDPNRRDCLKRRGPDPRIKTTTYFDKEVFEPIYDRIVVEPAAPVQSGIVVRPGTARQEPLRRGIVRQVGQGYRHFDGKIHPLEVKPGDRILYRHEGGGGAARAEEINLFGEELLIMREKLVWCIL